MWVLLFAFLAGSAVGSFLAALVDRTATERTMWGRSACDACGHALGAMDLMPVVSFLVLGRRCRWCKTAIPWRLFATELLTGALFAAAFWHEAGIPSVEAFASVPWLLILRDWTFLSFLVALFVYDVRFECLPDFITIPGMVVAFVWSFALGMSAQSLLVACAIFALFFWGQHAVSRGKWVGNGDARMGAMMGCMFGLANGTVALFLGYLFGAAVGVFLLATHRRERQSHLPLGAFLAAGSVVVLLTGSSIAQWYLSLLGI